MKTKERTSRKLEKGQRLVALESADLIYKYVTIQRTIRWALRQFKKKLAGDLPYDFPLIIARLVCLFSYFQKTAVGNVFARRWGRPASFNPTRVTARWSGANRQDNVIA